MYRLSCRTLGPIATNCYTVINESTNEAILIDATGKADILLKEVETAGARLVAVLLTHAHFDHIDAVEEVRKLYSDAVVYIGEHDAPLLGDPALNLSYSFTGVPVTVEADRTVKDGEEIELIGLNFRCIEVPGHTIGGMCYYTTISDDKDVHIVFDGDTLFHGSVGRSDFPTGDGETLIRSIKEKLLTLPEDTRVFPGHNSDSTIGWEKEKNFYFA